MSDWTPGRPEESEILGFATKYVACVEGDDLIGALESGSNEFRTMIAPASDDWAGTFRYQPGKWTLKEVIGHIVDAERIFTYRALRIARCDATPLPPFEQDDYIAPGRFNERPLADLMQEFSAVRAATLTLFRGLPRDAWARRGTVSSNSVTVRGLAFVTAGHEAYHRRILSERYLPHIG